MWVYTEYGMVSIVKDYDNPKNVLVRARDGNTLPALIEHASLYVTQEHTPERDYHYRISIDKAAAQFILMSLLRDMEYTNFKGHLHRTQRLSRLHRTIYEDVYYAALPLSDEDDD